MEYAIILTGGKQYRVSPGALLDVEKLDGEAGAEVQLEQVLAVRKESAFQVGRPSLTGTRVKAQIVAQTQGPKVINFKFKRRKGYHRKVGHRQELTRLKILEIL
ncbi:MAG: 50S ribosomal protein L21 [Candidatus Omnitrophica bacterium]|nr:50S ribosomal protein L21 [Candidatus Omnitrophota bacterium]